MDYRLLIARRYLVSRKRVSLISVITGISTVGVTIGVAALIVVLSVMNGFYEVVRDLMVSLDPHVRIVAAEERWIDDAETVQRVALTMPEVAHAAAYVEGKALIAHDGVGDPNMIVVVRGVDPASMEGMNDVVARVGFGSFDLDSRDGRPGVVIGMRLGQRLGLMPGSGTVPESGLRLLSAQTIERSIVDPFAMLQPATFGVRGLYEMDELSDESQVFVNIAEAQRLFRMGNRLTGVELRLHDIDDAERVQRRLAESLGPDYRVLTWYDLQRALYDVMQLEKWGASIILFLIIVVAAFNIVGSLTMVVVEKRRDVGVLRAMGASRKDIRRIFLAEGSLIGIVGGGIGVLLGVGLSLLQKHFELVHLRGADSFMIDAYPVAIRVLDVVLIAGVSLLLCLAAAWYPATRAASIEPSRAVQVEG